MFDIGFWELLLIAIVALVVVGPERLPKLVRVAGLWLGKATASFQSMRNDISRELRAEELQQALNKTVTMGSENLDAMNSILSPESDPLNTPDTTGSTKTASPVVENKNGKK